MIFVGGQAFKFDSSCANALHLVPGPIVCRLDRGVRIPSIPIRKSIGSRLWGDREQSDCYDDVRAQSYRRWMPDLDMASMERVGTTLGSKRPWALRHSRISHGPTWTI